MTSSSSTLPGPYLSIVVTSRNDNHGGDMLRRMQVFVTTILRQCRKYRLPAELIIVEWNPPVGAPSLESALDFSKKNRFCPVRIITVPNEYHRRFSHSDSLPLFQMIAKNVGIKRAYGEFVLATNIDVIFSSKLARFFSRQTLQQGTIYRIDRTDVDNDIPTHSSLREIEHYCKKHILRICTRERIIESTNQTSLLFRSVGLNHLPRLFNPVERMLCDVVPWLPSRKHLQSFLRPKAYNQQNFLLACRHLKRAGCQLRQTLLERHRRRHSLIKKEKPQLHTNACGDFTLLARKDWLDLRGNPEWEMFSFHLDSVFLYLADANGLKEKVLKSPYRLYHIEHSAGFTPSQGEQMYTRIRRLGIPILTSQDLAMHRKEIYKAQRLQPENSSDWGLAGVELTERVIS